MPEERQALVQVPTEVNLPEIHPAFDSLRELFVLSGQALQTGYGLAPITWTELRNFIELNELDLMLWEKRILRKMSEAFCAESSRATDPSRPAPYQPEKDDEEETVSDKIAQAVRIREAMNQFRKK